MQLCKLQQLEWNFSKIQCDARLIANDPSIVTWQDFKGLARADSAAPPRCLNTHLSRGCVTHVSLGFAAPVWRPTCSDHFQPGRSQPDRRTPSASSRQIADCRQNVHVLSPGTSALTIGSIRRRPSVVVSKFAISPISASIANFETKTTTLPLQFSETSNRSRSAISPGPVGCQPSFFRVCALEAGLSRPANMASQPK